MSKGTEIFKSPVWRVDFNNYSPGSICSRQWRFGNHFSGALVLNPFEKRVNLNIMKISKTLGFERQEINYEDNKWCIG